MIDIKYGSSGVRQIVKDGVNIHQANLNGNNWRPYGVYADNTALMYNTNTGIAQYSKDTIVVSTRTGSMTTLVENNIINDKNSVYVRGVNVSRINNVKSELVISNATVNEIAYLPYSGSDKQTLNITIKDATISNLMCSDMLRNMAVARNSSDNGSTISFYSYTSSEVYSEENIERNLYLNNATINSYSTTSAALYANFFNSVIIEKNCKQSGAFFNHSNYANYLIYSNITNNNFFGNCFTINSAVIAHNATNIYCPTGDYESIVLNNVAGGVSLTNSNNVKSITFLGNNTLSYLDIGQLNRFSKLIINHDSGNVKISSLIDIYANGGLSYIGASPYKIPPYIPEITIQSSPLENINYLFFTAGHPMSSTYVTQFSADMISKTYNDICYGNLGSIYGVNAHSIIYYLGGFYLRHTSSIKSINATTYTHYSYNILSVCINGFNYIMGGGSGSNGRTIGELSFVSNSSINLNAPYYCLYDRYFSSSQTLSIPENKDFYGSSLYLRESNYSNVFIYNNNTYECGYIFGLNKNNFESNTYTYNPGAIHYTYTEINSFSRAYINNPPTGSYYVDTAIVPNGVVFNELQNSSDKNNSITSCIISDNISYDSDSYKEDDLYYYTMVGTHFTEHSTRWINNSVWDSSNSVTYLSQASIKVHDPEAYFSYAAERFFKIVDLSNHTKINELNFKNNYNFDYRNFKGSINISSGGYIDGFYNKINTSVVDGTNLILNYNNPTLFADYYRVYNSTNFTRYIYLEGSHYVMGSINFQNWYMGKPKIHVPAVEVSVEGGESIIAEKKYNGTICGIPIAFSVNNDGDLMNSSVVMNSFLSSALNRGQNHISNYNYYCSIFNGSIIAKDINFVNIEFNKPTSPTTYNSKIFRSFYVSVALPELYNSTAYYSAQTGDKETSIYLSRVYFGNGDATWYSNAYVSKYVNFNFTEMNNNITIYANSINKGSINSGIEVYGSGSDIKYSNITVMPGAKIDVNPRNNSFVNNYVISSGAIAFGVSVKSDIIGSDIKEFYQNVFPDSIIRYNIEPVYVNGPFSNNTIHVTMNSTNSLRLDSITANELNISYMGSAYIFRLGLLNDPEISQLKISYNNTSINSNLSDKLNSVMYNNSSCTIYSNNIYGNINSAASDVSNIVSDILNNSNYLSPLHLDVRITNATINIDNSIFAQKIAGDFENWTYFNTGRPIIIPNNFYNISSNFIRSLINCESATIYGKTQKYYGSNGSLQIYADTVNAEELFNGDINKLNNNCQFIMDGWRYGYDNITLNDNCTAILNNSSAVCTNITLNSNASLINYSGTVLSLHLIGSEASYTKFSDNAVISKVYRDGELIEEN